MIQNLLICFPFKYYSGCVQLNNFLLDRNQYPKRHLITSVAATELQDVYLIVVRQKFLI